MVVRSKYKIGLLIFVIVCSILFFFIGYSIFPKEDNLRYSNVTTLLALFEIVLSFTFIISFLQLTPRIVFDDEFITVKKLFSTTVYDWNLATEAFLSSNEFILFKGWGDSTVIHFEDGQKFILSAGPYKNEAELRTVIKERLKDKIKDPVNKFTKINSSFFDQKKFAGNPFITNYTICILFIFLMPLFRITQSQVISIEGIFFLAVFLVPIFAAFGTQMNYFVLAGENLIIKNHYFFWKNKAYALSNILEVNIEQTGRRARALRIMTNDLESKTFCAGSLWKRQWRELRDDLGIIGIPVRVDTSID